MLKLVLRLNPEERSELMVIMVIKVRCVWKMPQINVK